MQLVQVNILINILNYYVWMHISLVYMNIIHISVFKPLGDAVVNVYINHEKKFAFVEMRTVEEASNAMALDGITFEVWNWFTLSSHCYV